MAMRWLRRSGAGILVPNVGIPASFNTDEKSFGAFDVGRLERMSAKIVDIVWKRKRYLAKGIIFLSKVDCL